MQHKYLNLTGKKGLIRELELIQKKISRMIPRPQRKEYGSYRKR